MGSRLTVHERTVLSLLKEGRGDAFIAEQLGVSLHTLRATLQTLAEKLQAIPAEAEA